MSNVNAHKRDAMQDFVDWAIDEWGAPTQAERARANEILCERPELPFVPSSRR